MHKKIHLINPYNLQTQRHGDNEQKREREREREREKERKRERYMQ